MSGNKSFHLINNTHNQKSIKATNIRNLKTALSFRPHLLVIEEFQIHSRVATFTKIKYPHSELVSKSKVSQIDSHFQEEKNLPSHLPQSHTIIERFLEFAFVSSVSGQLVSSNDLRVEESLVVDFATRNYS